MRIAGSISATVRGSGSACACRYQRGTLSALAEQRRCGKTSGPAPATIASNRSDQAFGSAVFTMLSRAEKVS